MQSKIEAEELVRQRFAALEAQDFAALYASYHPQSPFLEQFPSLEAYLDFAAQALAKLKLSATSIGAARETEEGIELICGLSFELAGESQTLYELALLMQAEEGWRYHSAQKLSAEDYSGEFAALDFSHFDQQATKIRF